MKNAKTWIIIGIVSASIVIIYVIYKVFIEKDVEEFKGGGYGWNSTRSSRQASPINTSIVSSINHLDKSFW